MDMNIVVPALGESVVEATVSRWLKKEGDPVNAGEVLVELETDKVNLEVGAEKAGVLSRIVKRDGEDVKVGDLLGVLAEGQAAAAAKEQKGNGQGEPATAEEQGTRGADVRATPSARRLAQEMGVDIQEVQGSGAGNQVTRQDVQNHVDRQKTPPQPSPAPALNVVSSGAPARKTPENARPGSDNSKREERIKMSRRRRTIAQRLVEAQHNAAMLTTYNEIDMSAIVETRKRHKDNFKEKYGVNLGFVSFFVKASIGALKDFPQLNTEIEGDEIILKHYYDIGVAIGASEGLVVPVLRDADRMSFAEIESAIKEFAKKAEDGTLSLEDLRGGTFTITNGGVFGSLLSTPILNPPQVGILGLHKMEERPVAIDGQVMIRPMMYVALSYDHRVVDGRESVQFLARIKALIEDPAALMLQV